MSETKFEVGKKYRTKGGGWRFIESIDDDEYLPINALDEEGNEGWYYPADGEYHCSYSDKYDLLLPAIEPEGAAQEASELSEPTINALKAYREFWDDFRLRVLGGQVDATNGRTYPYLVGSGGCVACNYATGLDAISDASAVIAAINSLLEGRAG